MHNSTGPSDDQTLIDNHVLYTCVLQDCIFLLFFHTFSQSCPSFVVVGFRNMCLVVQKGFCGSQLCTMKWI